MISVIIAVYNPGKYFDKCIESIRSQTYSDYEVILVDDGSTDGSAEECDRYCRDDQRFKVIHKENGGAASARNAGIDIATGDYFVFIDSDDYVDQEMFANMLEKAQSDPEITFINCGMIVQYPDKAYVIRKSDCEKTLNSEEGLISFFKGEGLITASFADKLIRRDVFDRGLRFDETIGNEDTEIVPRLIDLSDKILIDDNAYYHYVKHVDSTSENKLFSLRIYGFIPSLFKFREMCRDKYPNALPWYDYYLANTYNGMYEYLNECDDRKKYGPTALKIRMNSLNSCTKAIRHREVSKEKKGPLEEYMLRAFLGQKLFNKMFRSSARNI